MIIELDNSLAERTLRDASLDSAVSIALDNITTAQREGNHLVFAEFSTLESLRKVQHWFGPKINAMLTRVANRYPQLAKFARSVCVKLVVGDFEALKIEVSEEIRKIYVPVEQVTTRLLQRTLLLVENLSDATFYKWITERVLRRSDYKDCFLAVEGYPGGGNTTAEAYDHIKNETGRLCLCIVDSDVRCPGNSPGETAAKVRKSDTKQACPRTYHHVLPVCSVENLVPLQVFDAAWQSDPILQGRLQEYRPLYKDDIWGFLQLKKQTKCIDLVSSTAFAKFWSVTLPIGEPADACRKRSPEERCKNRDECGTVSLPALANSPLTAALTQIQDGGEPKDYELLPSVATAWRDIARYVTGWCCGSTLAAA